MVELPTGVGIYLRKITKEIYESPKRAAQKVFDSGLSFVCMPSIWQEKGTRDINASKVEEEYAQAFREKGIGIQIWGYPDVGGEPEFIRVMMEHATRLHADGLLLDIEKPYKGRDNASRALCSNVVAAMHGTALTVGVTSYGRLDWHHLLPLKEYGWHSPQVYTVTAEAARKSIATWGSGHMVPSIPTYGPNSGGQLGAYLGAIEDLCDGIIAWSWNSMSNLEWKTLERWAFRIGIDK